MPEPVPEMDLEQLARQELMGEEVHLLLERLSVIEFQGSEHPTVRDVAESAGVSPIMVGEMLAEIRQENLHAVFGSRLDEQAAEIQRLKSTAKRHSPEVDAELVAVARERIQGRRHDPLLIVISLAILLAIFVGSNSNARSSGVEAPSRTVSTRMDNGAEYYVNEKFDEWVQLPNGTKRAPTVDERGRYGTLLMTLIAKPPGK